MKNTDSEHDARSQQRNHLDTDHAHATHPAALNRRQWGNYISHIEQHDQIPRTGSHSQTNRITGATMRHRKRVLTRLPSSPHSTSNATQKRSLKAGASTLFENRGCWDTYASDLERLTVMPTNLLRAGVEHLQAVKNISDKHGCAEIGLHGPRLAQPCGHADGRWVQEVFPTNM